MKSLSVLAVTMVFLAWGPAAIAQTADPTTVPETVPLWSGRAPGALGEEEADRPALTVYRPRTSQANATAVIVAPGGGYRNLAANHEGRQVANWLNSLGVTALVLKYRLGPRYHHPIQLQDAQRALRLARYRAQDLGIAADRVGMMGFSAGGHLAATAATHFDGGDTDAPDPIDRQSSRPDFLILGYPVISFTGPAAHRGSVLNLLGENPDPRLLSELSNQFHVSPDTPPAFLFHTSDDAAVPVENSITFYQALRKAGVPAEMHIFETGPHGVGLDLGNPVLGEWPRLLANWLRARGLLAKPSLSLQNLGGVQR